MGDNNTELGRLVEQLDDGLTEIYMLRSEGVLLERFAPLAAVMDEFANGGWDLPQSTEQALTPLSPKVARFVEAFSEQMAESVEESLRVAIPNVIGAIRGLVGAGVSWRWTEPDEDGLMEAVFTDEPGSECGRLRLNEDDVKFVRPVLEECRVDFLI